MSKGSFANEEIMEEYLDALLSETPAVKTHKTAASVPVFEHEAKSVKSVLDGKSINPVEHLLDQVTPELEVTEIPKKIAQQPEPIVQAETVKQSELAQTPEDNPVKDYHTGEFQALFFEVAGLILAVPLTELGGIHNLTDTSPLFGKPKWFKGVMVNREEKLHVVDTAQWVMPEKCTPELVNTLTYKYIIMLGESNWGLSCEKLINTVTLNQEDIKWRAGSGKRPWLAGLVKEKMCALLDVEQLISLLNNGLDSQDG